MDIESLVNKSLNEMIEFMKTDCFANLVKGDATVATIVEYSRILLSNYHAELKECLKSEGIDI